MKRPGLRPYARCWWRGKPFDHRTVSALEAAEKAWRRKARTSKTWSIGQGSYSHGSLSAGTHSGGGAVDIMSVGLTDRELRIAVNVLRIHGFAAWYRGGAGSGWAADNYHIHAILLKHRSAAPGAKQQTVAYVAGRDGLAGNRVDTTWRPKRPRRWSHLRKRIVYTKRWEV